MRKLIFVSFIVLGAAVGLFSALYDDWGVCVRRRHLDAGDDDQDAVVGAVQRCGSKSSTRLAGWVGSRSRMSFRYA